MQPDLSNLTGLTELNLDLAACPNVTSEGLLAVRSLTSSLTTLKLSYAR
jgi:hypothetical protein